MTKLMTTEESRQIASQVAEMVQKVATNTTAMTGVTVESFVQFHLRQAVPIKPVPASNEVPHKSRS